MKCHKVLKGLKKINMFENKSILITGGTGSFGKAFVKYILKKYKNINRLIIFSRDEFKQYEVCGSILHIGTQNGGHYITILKRGDGKWYLHDDDSLKEVTFPKKATHHVLMYRIRNQSS